MAHRGTSRKHGGRGGADDALVLALAAGQTIEAAAAKAGISRRTAHRRLNDPEFQTRLSAARAEMTGRTIGRLTILGAKAVSALQGLLKSEKEPVRLAAAVKILELGSRLRERAELDEHARRLAELERLLRKGKHGDGDDNGGDGATPDGAGDTGPGPEPGGRAVSGELAAGPGAGDDPGADGPGSMADDPTPFAL